MRFCVTRALKRRIRGCVSVPLECRCGCWGPETVAVGREKRATRRVREYCDWRM